MKSVLVHSDLYGTETHGPYDNATLADEAIDRLKQSAAGIGDDVEREYSIIDYEDEDEDEDEETDKTKTTPLPSQYPHMILVGSFIEGFKCVGPFKDFERACEWEEGRDNTEVVRLHDPTGGLVSWTEQLLKKTQMFLEGLLDSSEECQSSSDGIDTLDSFQKPARELLRAIQKTI